MASDEMKVTCLSRATSMQLSELDRHPYEVTAGGVYTALRRQSPLPEEEDEIALSGGV